MDIKQERILPTGLSEFETLISDLKTAYTLPTDDVDSIKFAVAAIIMHLGPDESHKSLEFFYKRVIAGASKQVAGAVFYEVKERQKAAQAALEASKNETQQ